MKRLFKGEAYRLTGYGIRYNFAVQIRGIFGTLVRRTNENYSALHGKKNICTPKFQNNFPAAASRQFDNKTQIETGESQNKKIAGTGNCCENRQHR
ncbi:MAG: hypothetical protein LBJ00_12010 [Planctomycetaceae bacterium]|nr:hypothetical protein [Planctomycetaceae bacterium]